LDQNFENKIILIFSESRGKYIFNLINKNKINLKLSIIKIKRKENGFKSKDEIRIWNWNYVQIFEEGMEEDISGVVKRLEIAVVLMVGLFWNCTACCGHGIPFHLWPKRFIDLPPYWIMNIILYYSLYYKD